MSEPKVQIVWNSPEEKAVVLENATIVRPISLPENWRIVKLGIRYNITGSSVSNITGTPRLYVGFCSGSNVIGDPTVDFFIGYRSNAATWTYTSSSTYTREWYSYAVGTLVVNLGGNLTSSTDIVSNTHYNDKICGVFKPTVFNMIITRSLDESNTQYRIVGGYYDGSSAFAGFTSTQFLEDMTVASNAGLTGMNVTNAYTTNPVGFRGGIDNVLVAWDKETPFNGVAILDIAIAAFE